MARSRRWMQELLMVGVLVLPAVGWAQVPLPTQPAPGSVRARFEVRARTLRVLEISAALGLTEPETLALSETVGAFEDRRNPLQREMQQNAQALRRAARGDATAFAQVEGAVSRMQALRDRIQAVDWEMLQKLSAGLTPQKKAILSLTLARLPNELREAAREAKKESKAEKREARGRGPPKQS